MVTAVPFSIILTEAVRPPPSLLIIGSVIVDGLMVKLNVPAELVPAPSFTVNEKLSLAVSLPL